MVTQAIDKIERAELLKEYEQKKSQLIHECREIFKSSDISFSLKKDTSNLFRRQNEPDKKIDVRSFNKIHYVDPVNLVAEIEGMASYEDIVKATLKFNCLPTVVPEFKTITIGGALAGVGIEASSFRFGLVHETIIEYEILLPDGRIVLCRPDNEYKELYYAFPNTYGTLGYALKVKVKLIRTKPYVRVTHLYFSDPTIYFDTLKQYCHQNRENGTLSFIEGVIFDKTDLTISVGEFVDQVPFISNYKFMNIYYRSIKAKNVDFLTSEDYIWRWDTDWFWCSKHFYMQNSIFRFLFGKYLLSSRMYWKIKNFVNRNSFVRSLSEMKYGSTESVIQDVQIPLENAEQFLNYFQNEIGIKPIWICPIQPYFKVPYSFYKMDPSKLYVNFGFWDLVQSHQFEGYYNQLIERKVTELQGNKSLYSSVYYTPKEFWSIYDKELYSKLKEEYDPNHRLNDLYKKCIGK